jgi:hypothetical protein
MTSECQICGLEERDYKLGMLTRLLLFELINTANMSSVFLWAEHHAVIVHLFKRSKHLKSV